MDVIFSSFSSRKAAAGLVALGGLTGASFAHAGLLDDLGWFKSSQGSELRNSPAVVAGNEAQGEVTSVGGSAGVLANIGARADMPGVAQASSVRLRSVDASGGIMGVLENRSRGLIRAIGGSALANSIDVDGAKGRRVLANNQLAVVDNRAEAIEAAGGKGSVGIGMVVADLTGQAMANTQMASDSDLRNNRLYLTSNVANRIHTFGGGSLANSLMVGKSTFERVTAWQDNNRAHDVDSGGGKGGIGFGHVASADLSGMSAANSVLAVDSSIRGAQLLQSDNRASKLSAMGGNTLANSLRFGKYQGGDLGQYQARITGNQATEMSTRGGSGKVLHGALAEVQATGSALANSVLVDRGQLQGGVRHTVQDNTATHVSAVGGAAAANSVWLSDATVKGGGATLTDNRASNISTSGGNVSAGGGLLADFQRRGRALANTLVAEAQALLDGARVRLAGNTSRNVQGYGGMAAAGSVMVTGSNGKLAGNVQLSDNTAQKVSATGFKDSVGGGLAYSSTQNAATLANSVGVFDAQVDGGSRLQLANNTASRLDAQGGMINANSVTVEKNGTRLAAPVTLVGNTATDMISGAGSSAGPLNSFGSSSRARAAANSLVLHDQARLQGGSVLLWDNRAWQVGAMGGTSLVNTLAAYRGARVEDSRVVIAGNQASNIRAGGGSSHVMSVGDAKNGILAANGAYLDGLEGISLRQMVLGVFANQAHDINVDGGRVNANALALNSHGKIQGGSVLLAGNEARQVRSQGNEKQAAGVTLNKGVGHASANSVQVLGEMQQANAAIVGNTARDVQASKGLAAANSLQLAENGKLSNSSVTVLGNRVDGVEAKDSKTALAASVLNEGTLRDSGVLIAGNEAGARAGKDDALAASVRNTGGSKIERSQVSIAGNRGKAQGGSINSVDNRNGGSVTNSTIHIANNEGGSQRDSVVNSVRNEGRIASSRVTIAGNLGQTQRGGTVNSLDNTKRGVIDSSRISITQNTGTAGDRGATINSVRNEGRINNATIMVHGNRGNASGNGTVNSVRNEGGRISGQVLIANNQGTSSSDGIANSLINKRSGEVTGRVVIANNQGHAGWGGTSNSVINSGRISGTVAIVGNQSVAGPLMTRGTVEVKRRGTVAGIAGVVANQPFALNGAVTPGVSPVISRSVIVGAANNKIYR